MASYIPSAAGRALQESSENILEAIIRRAQMEQQESQFVRGLDLRERELGLRQEEFTERQKGNALTRITQFAPFLVGQRVADVDFLHEDFQALYPEFDPADEMSLGAMSFGDKTFAQLLDERLIEQLDELPDGVLERGIVLRITGEGGTFSSLALQEDITEIQRDHLEEIMQNPETLQMLGNRLFNMPDQLTARFPDGKGGWQEISWRDEATARLSVSIWGMLRQTAGGEGDKNKLLMEMAKDLQGIAEEEGYGVPLHMARTIVTTVHSGDQEALNDLQASLAEQGSEAGIAALEIYLSGADLAQGVSNRFFEEFPELGLYVNMAAEIEGAVGKEMAAEIMPLIAKRMRDAGVRISAPTGWGPWSGFDIGPRRVTQPEGTPQVDPGQQRSAMRQQMQADAEAYARRQITMQDLVAKYGRSGAMAVVQDARRMREGGQ